MKLAIFASLVCTSVAFAPVIIFNQQQRTSTPSALNVAIDTSDIKNGLTIELDGEPYKVLNFSIMKQARGAAKTTIKFKNLRRGTTIENTYRSGEKFETAEVLRKPSQYSYNDEAGNYFFMDSESFEEVMVESKIMEDQKKWITDGMECDLIFFKGEVIEIRTPNPYVYEVVETEPNVKQDFKPAVLDCGATVNVPGFVEQGSKVKVDTEKGEYLERA